MSKAEPKETKWKTGLVVVCNFIIFVIYSLYFKFIQQHDLMLYAFILCFHTIICMLIYALTKKGGWVLSAGLVLFIGFATCTNYLTK